MATNDPRGPSFLGLVVATDPAHSFAFDVEQVCHLCGAHLDAAHLEDTALGPVCLFCGMPAPSTSSAEEVPAPALEVGEALRGARLRRGISLEDAAIDTCIRATHLRALEDDEPPKDYPGPVYTRFFLHEYAEYLELDDGPLLAAFDRAIPEEPVPPLEPAVVRREPPGWAITAFVSTLALVVVLIVSHSASPDVAPGTGASAAAAQLGVAPSPSVGVAHSPPVGNARETPRSAAPTGPEGIHAVIGVTAPCWILAVIDGHPTAGRTVPAGETVRFRAHRSIDLKLGNAGGAVLRVNGERFPTGPDGQVLRISFAQRHGVLIAS